MDVNVSARRAGRVITAAVALFMIVFGTVAVTAANADPYNTNPSLSLSASTAQAGSTITVTGTGYVPNEIVSIDYNGNKYHFKDVRADANGNFTTTITLPANLVGNFQVVGTGEKKDKAQAKLRVTGLGIAGASASRGNGNAGANGASSGSLGVDAASAQRGDTGGLSSTGVAVFTIVGIGVLLVLAGGFVLVTGRRSRHAS